MTTYPTSTDLAELRGEVQGLNTQLLELLNKRAQLVTAIQGVKQRDGLEIFSPEREHRMLTELVKLNKGPFSDQTIRQLFKEIFRASLDLMQAQEQRVLHISRAKRPADLLIQIRDVTIGLTPMLLAGPCAVESEAQLDAAASALSAMGVRLLRGGAFKPRSSPYSFQGLGEPGLKILQKVAKRYGMVSVTEVTDTRSVDLVREHADILQIGSRNMFNYELLREVGRSGAPVLLKRGLAATIEEFLWAAEYIVREGNERVILCERGIRTYERQTRNTLDLSAVPLLRVKSYLPVFVDVSHAAGRKDILTPLGKAALAVGAQGVMVETHPCPHLARSDSEQQLDLDEMNLFAHELGLWAGSTATVDQHGAARPRRIAT